MAREHAAGRVSLAALFAAFLGISLGGFGAGVVLARDLAVVRRGWISDEEFADILSLTQLMPGPNMIGIAVCVGAKLRGADGAIAAAGGFLMPLTAGFAASVLLLRYAPLGALQNILGGVSAAAAGMLIATGARLLLPHRRRPQSWSIAALSCGGLAVAKWPLIVVLLALAPLGIAVAALAERRRR
jgi:chromate transporter